MDNYLAVQRVKHLKTRIMIRLYINMNVTPCLDMLQLVAIQDEYVASNQTESGNKLKHLVSRGCFHLAYNCAEKTNSIIFHRSCNCIFLFFPSSDEIMHDEYVI